MIPLTKLKPKKKNNEPNLVRPSNAEQINITKLIKAISVKRQVDNVSYIEQQEAGSND